MITKKTGHKPNQDLTDNDLVKEILLGKSHLQELLYSRYADRIYAKCYSITRDSVESKDLAHDIFIKIFLNLHKFKGEADFSFWVKSITYNYCMDFLKKKKRFRLEPIENLEWMNPDKEEEENEQVLLEMRLKDLQDSFSSLKGREKIILLMKYKDGYSVKEIANLLSISESAVKMRLKRSRDHLAHLVKDDAV